MGVVKVMDPEEEEEEEEGVWLLVRTSESPKGPFSKTDLFETF